MFERMPLGARMGLIAGPIFAATAAVTLWLVRNELQHHGLPEANTCAWHVGGIVLLALAVLLVTMNLLGQRIVGRPLERLRQTAQRISQEPQRIGERIGGDFPLELGAVAEAFNAMSAALKSERDALETRVHERTAELERLNTALRLSEQRFRRVFESNMIGIFFWDRAGLVITDANQAFLDLVGYTRADLDAGRLNHALLIPPERYEQSRQLQEELATTGRMGPTEGLGLHHDGHRIPIVVGGAILDDAGTMVVSFVLDRTPQLAAEEKARERQAQVAHLARVGTMGQMATSLAHELNQPLGAIRNYAGVAGDMLATRPAGYEDVLATAVREIAGETARAAGIVQRVRSFVRRSPARTQRVNLHALVNEAAQLLGHDLAQRHVQVACESADQNLCVDADPVQLQQVLVNLLTNAADACADQPPDRRRITVRTAYVPGDATGSFPGRATIAVEDTGAGVPPADMAKMFEPFHTTKPRGLGMGLSIARTIVEDHGGRIAARARDGGGMIFEVALPAAPVQKE